ncbi:hypothetical protein [Methylotuvimicrobium sp.]
MNFIDHLLDALETWDRSPTCIAETVKNQACFRAGIHWDELSDDSGELD